MMMIIDASERKRRVGSPNQLKTTSRVYRENRYGCTVDALGERKREREKREDKTRRVSFRISQFQIIRTQPIFGYR